MSARWLSFVLAVLVALVVASMVKKAAAALPGVLEAGEPRGTGASGASDGWTGRFSK